MTVSNHDHLYSAVKKTWIYVRKKKKKKKKSTSLSHQQDVYELWRMFILLEYDQLQNYA